MARKTTSPTTTQQGPRLSFCYCGHTGNVADSEHGPRYAPGHGACLVEGCDCKQFTWAHFAPEPEVARS